MDFIQYLHRLQVNKPENPSYSFLSKLQEQHLLTVPFENLDIHQGNKIVLDEDRIYEKIVIGGRGGFCYELNGLYCWLLRSLGFTVSMASARVYMPTKERFSPEFDHMVLLVELEKTYLVDVGFGDSFRKPIALPDGQSEDISGSYRLRTFASGQDTYILQKKDKNDWQTVYSFTKHPRVLSDFEEMNAFNQSSPESHFTQQTICSIATKNGRVSLSDDFLTITDGSSKRKTKVTSQTDFEQKLRDHFGIQLNYRNPKNPKSQHL
jgi:N-hydroxyarylamine O-acetyltransferase